MEANFGRSSMPKPTGSQCSTQFPPWYTLYLYICPGFAPSMNSSQNFPSPVRLRYQSSQPLKSPITDTPSAFGAYTLNIVPKPL